MPMVKNHRHVHGLRSTKRGPALLDQSHCVLLSISRNIQKKKVCGNCFSLSVVFFRLYENVYAFMLFGSLKFHFCGQFGSLATLESYMFKPHFYSSDILIYLKKLNLKIKFKTRMQKENTAYSPWNIKQYFCF